MSQVLDGEPAIDGADPTTVRTALESGEPLHGTAGFAGAIDGGLVRDVLGRRSVYYERDGATLRWDFCPSELDNPSLLPAGARLTTTGLEPVWSLPDTTLTDDPQTAAADLAAVIETVLDEFPSAAPIAFSGGLDSGILAALTDGPCYVVSFPGGRDLEAARASAAAMGRSLTEVSLTPDRLAAAVPEVVAATGRQDPMDVAIAVPLYIVGTQVAADGYERLLLGQGADELFAGYEKVARAATDERVVANDVRSARDESLSTLPDQLPRDICAIRAAGVEPSMPLLHDRIVRVARSLPTALLVDDYGTRKVALRLAARRWLPHTVAFRPKTAIQYGSYVSRELDRLARQAGFKRRMDNHVERYIASLS